MASRNPTTERACPICGNAATEAMTSVLPFCSERCRNIDLGRWLGERYRIAVEVPDDGEENPDDPIADRPADLRRGHN